MRQLQPPADRDCAGAGDPDCVTDNEGISGNQVVDPTTGNVYIAHTTTNGIERRGRASRVSEGKITPGHADHGHLDREPQPRRPPCARTRRCVDASGNPEELAGENFASIARDSAGYLYVTFTAGPLDHANSSRPELRRADRARADLRRALARARRADPSTLTWSAPTAITGSGVSAGTNTFPWITAGSDGRVDVAWYHTDEISEQGTCASGSGTCTLYGAGSLHERRVDGADGAEPGRPRRRARATRPPTSARRSVKHGQICTNGIGCATGGDRSLGDFLQVTTDAPGRGARLLRVRHLGATPRPARTPAPR